MISVLAKKGDAESTGSAKRAPFVFFALMTVVQFVVVLVFYPETKGVTLEDMEKKLRSA